MINSKKLVVGILTVGVMLISSCDNKKEGEVKKVDISKKEEAKEGRESETLSCTLNDELKEKIHSAIKKIFKKGVTVKSIRNSSVPGMVEAEVVSPEGIKGLTLFDCSGRYMLIGKLLKIGVPQGEESESGGGCLEEGIAKEKVSSILKGVFGSAIDVIEVNKTPISSLYEIVVREPSGRNEVIYMDCDLKNIVLGTIIDIKENRNLTAEKRKELLKDFYKEKEKKLIAKIGEKKFKELKNIYQNSVYQLEVIDIDKVKIPEKGFIVYGNPDANYTIYIISDPQCPFCARLDETVKSIASSRKDVNFKIYFYPLKFHQYAKGISENILCQESNEKRKEILEKSFKALRERNKEELKNLQGGCPEGKQILQEHMKFAKDVNLRGTPLIIFPNGIAISGAISKETLNKTIDILSKKD